MVTKKQPASKEPRRPGRPAIEEGIETVPVVIRMTVNQRAKLKRLGGPPWVRDRIDRAKERT